MSDRDKTRDEILRELNSRRRRLDELEHGHHDHRQPPATSPGTPARDCCQHASNHLDQPVLESNSMEAIGRLAGGIAHEFNNLLTVILGYSDLALLSLPANNPARCHVQEIKAAGARAATLTRQLLAFGRQQILQPQVVDLNAIVNELTDMLAQVIGEDIDLQTRLDPSLGQVRVDPGQMGQVMVNLAANARDAMPRGGRLLIETANLAVGVLPESTHLEPPPGRYALLVVSDTGQGMDEATRARVFDPFFTTKEVGRGTGLGLAVVHGLIKQSAGHIAVQSAPGRGTTFRIYLPLVDGAA